VKNNITTTIKTPIREKILTSTIKTYVSLYVKNNITTTIKTPIREK